MTRIERFSLPPFEYKAFIKSLFTKNIMIKLFSLLIAVAFYVINELQTLDERVITVPLRIRDVPSGLTVSSEVPERVSVLLTGKKASLANLDVNFIYAYIALRESRTLKPREYTLNVTGTIPQAVKVVNTTPARINITLSRIMRRRVPVEPELVNDPMDGYVIKHYHISPSSIWVEGPRNIVSDVVYLRTERILLDNLKNNTVFEKGISKNTSPLLRFNQDKKFKVSVVIVPKYKGKSLQLIPVETLNLGTNLHFANSKDCVLSEVELDVPITEIELITNGMPVGLYVDCTNIDKPGTYILPVVAKPKMDLRIKRWKPIEFKVKIIEQDS